MQHKTKETQNQKLLYKTLVAIIKKHRKSLKKSIYKLSAEVELDRSSWSRLEKLESLDPSFTTIWKIAEALDIYPDELIKEVREKLGDDFSLSGLN